MAHYGRGKYLFVAAALLTLAVAVSVAVSGCTSSQGTIKAESGKTEGGAQSRQVAAIVNGFRIYLEDVNMEYYSVPPSQLAGVTKADALSFVIEREVLYQEAVKQGFNASDEEAEEEFAAFLKAGNMTEGQLAEKLAESASSVSIFKSVLRKQILINKLLDREVTKSFIIKREEALDAYSAGKFSSFNISFDEAEKSIVDSITRQKAMLARQRYIDILKGKADVLIFAVAG